MRYCHWSCSFSGFGVYFLPSGFPWGLTILHRDEPKTQRAVNGAVTSQGFPSPTQGKPKKRNDVAGIENVAEELFLTLPSGCLERFSLSLIKRKCEVLLLWGRRRSAFP